MSETYQPTGYCPRCGYQMDAGRCPECGKAVSRPAKRDPRAGRGRLLRAGRRLVTAMLLVLAMYYGGGYAVFAWWPTSHLRVVAARKDWLSERASAIMDWRCDLELSRAQD